MRLPEIRTSYVDRDLNNRAGGRFWCTGFSNAETGPQGLGFSLLLDKYSRLNKERALKPVAAEG